MMTVTELALKHRLCAPYSNCEICFLLEYFNGNDYKQRIEDLEYELKESNDIYDETERELRDANAHIEEIEAELEDALSIIDTLEAQKSELIEDNDLLAQELENANKT